MSQLFEPDPDACQETEPEGQEYEYCMFKQVLNIHMMQNVPKLTQISGPTVGI